MILELKHISVELGKRNIVQDVSLSVSTGLNYLIGLNGSGKTSLIRAVSGQLEHEGEVLLDGKMLKHLPPRERARLIAVVPQRLDIPFETRVYDFILMGRFPWTGLFGSYAPDDHRRTKSVLKELGITHLRDRGLHEVSGGEFQKALLARSLAQDTPVILMDEPAHFLDPKNKMEFYRRLHELAGEKVVLCATHDREALTKSGSKIFGMEAGKLILTAEGGEGIYHQLDRFYQLV